MNDESQAGDVARTTAELSAALVPIFSKNCELDVRPKSQKQGASFQDIIFWSEVPPNAGELFAAELQIYLSDTSGVPVYLSDAKDDKDVALDTIDPITVNLVRLAYSNAPGRPLTVTVTVDGNSTPLTPARQGRPDANSPVLPPKYLYTRRRNQALPKVRELVIRAWNTTFSLYLVS